MFALSCESDALIRYGEGKIQGWSWPFFLNDESSDVSVEVSLAMTLGFFVLCLAMARVMFKTGFRLES